MITTTLEWHTDMSSAPRGETISTLRSYLHKGKAIERVETSFVPSWVLVLSPSGTIHRTYWKPAKHTQSGAVLDGYRWEALPRGVDPIAWAMWPDAAELLEAVKLEAVP